MANNLVHKVMFGTFTVEDVNAATKETLEGVGMLDTLYCIGLVKDVQLKLLKLF
jgi:hypothetical protein